jgi:hypothetical protein
MAEGVSVFTLATDSFGAFRRPVSQRTATYGKPWISMGTCAQVINRPRMRIQDTRAPRKVGEKLRREEGEKGTRRYKAQ